MTVKSHDSLAHERVNPIGSESAAWLEARFSRRSAGRGRLAQRLRGVGCARQLGPPYLDSMHAGHSPPSVGPGVAHQGPHRLAHRGPDAIELHQSRSLAEMPVLTRRLIAVLTRPPRTSGGRHLSSDAGYANEPRLLGHTRSTASLGGAGSTAQDLRHQRGDRARALCPCAVGRQRLAPAS